MWCMAPLLAFSWPKPVTCLRLTVGGITLPLHRGAKKHMAREGMRRIQFVED